MKFAVFISLCVLSSLASAACSNASDNTDVAKIPLPPDCPDQSTCQPPMDAISARLLAFETYHLAPISSTDTQSWLSDATLKSHPEQHPPETIPLLVNVIKPNMIHRSVFRTCDGSAYYFLDRGGLIDQSLWFGPVMASGFTDGKDS